ncbi:MAG: hypothetical protein HFG84_12520 [Dorea sp.]|nr:hypothetical protein [Dorea sp.]
MKRKGLTSYQLKWLAIVTMVIDHVGAVFFPGVWALRYVGRISFPIFCFLLVEGFVHTRDVRKYMIRLGGFALVSEVPYDLAFYGKVVELDHQNVFFTLLLGVALMELLKYSKELPLKAVEILSVMASADLLRTDYSFKGILLIALFYLLRENLWIKTVCGALWNFLWNGSIQGYGALAMIPIALYNGERGKSMKYFFYMFYPAHLLVLFLVHSAAV